MAKNKKPAFNYGSEDLFDGQSLSKDPAVQKIKAFRATQAASSSFSEPSGLPELVQGLQYRKEDYLDVFNTPGGTYGTPEEIDYKLADNQSTTEQLGMGLARLLPVTMTKLVGQVNALKQGAKYFANGMDPNTLVDDEYAGAIQAWEDDIKKALPIYATREYNDGSLFQQMGTAKFWADDFGDGVSFLAAQFIGTKGISSGASILAKGASLVGKATGAAEVLAQMPAAAKVANAIAKNYNTVTAGFVNSASTAALQAQDTVIQIKEQLAGQINPETGTTYTEQEIKDIAGDRGANTFNATFLTHILPEIWQARIFLGANKAKLGDLAEGVKQGINSGTVTWESLLGGSGINSLYQSSGKEFLKGALKGAAIEGLYEENIEQSIQNYDIQTGITGKGNEAGKRILNYAMGMLTNLGTKEDGKAVLLGALLGGPMGGFGGAAGVSERNKQMKDFVDSLKTSNSTYGEDIKSIYKTHAEDVKDAEGNITHKKGDLVLDDKNQPIQDLEALKKLTFQIINNKQLWDRQTVAALSGNTDMATLNENVALSSAVFRELSNPYFENTEGALDFLKWRVKSQIEEQTKIQQAKENLEASTSAAALISSDGTAQGDIEAQQAAIDAKSQASRFSGRDKSDITRVVNENIARLDKFEQFFKDAQKQGQRLTKVGQSADRMAFNEVAKKGLYYEAVKRESIDQMVQSRQEALKDPLADSEKIAQEIEALGRLRADSLAKSQAYLNNTDEVYNAFSGPQQQLVGMRDAWSKVNDKINNASDLESKAKLERNRDTLAYQLSELNELEGLGDPIVFNEEAVSRPISERARKPVGLKNTFFWDAGQDYTAVNNLNQKIDQYEAGEVSLKDVIAYAEETVSRLDDDTRNRLGSLITKERDTLANLEDQLANSSAEEWEVDEETGEDIVTPNPEYPELVQKVKETRDNIEASEQLLDKKEKADSLNMINNQPDKVGDYLVKKIAESKADKGKYVVRNAIGPDGEVREDYFDQSTVNSAIAQLTQMRNAIEDRLEEGGDLHGKKGFSYLIKDADALLAKLVKVREQVSLNRNNREGKQAELARKESITILAGLGFDAISGSVQDTVVYNQVNGILDGTLKKFIAEIQNLDKGHYEATMALLHRVQSKATPGQLSQLDKTIKAVQDRATATVSTLLKNTSKGNSLIIKGFGKNPRQFFHQAWINISVQNKDFGQIVNKKGNLYNLFQKNNDIEEIISKAEALPDDTKELGMPKPDFIALASAYKAAVAGEKTRILLSSSLKPIVKAELKSSETAAITPTTQQDIAIREGVALLKGKESKKPFGNWSFLRGIAGTGKTNIVLKWMLDALDMDKNDILSTALTPTAAQVVAESTGTSAMTFGQLENSAIPDNVKLIIIDEYGTIGTDRLLAFEAKIAALDRGIKVLMLGDPTQITPRLQNNDDINNITQNTHAGNIRIINPLTVVYRSDLSAVNEASDIFQDNDAIVPSISVRATHPVGTPLALGVHTSSSAAQIADIIQAGVKEEQERGLPARTRAIIVGSIADMAKYEGLPADVMTVFDAQSRTYDEVYTDISQKDFRAPEQYNTAMYTAASRAKKYSFIVYPQGVNMVDPDLNAETSNNLNALENAKTVFIQAKTEELAMMEGLDKGKGIKETAKDKAVQEEVKNAGKSDVQVETEKAQTEDDLELVAETPGFDTVTDDTHEGEVDPDTEEDALPVQEIPEIASLPRQAVDNIDGEAYPALRSGLISPGSRVIYLYNKEQGSRKGQNAVTLFAHGKDGNWVRIGKIFQEQIDKDPRYEDIAKKIAGMKPFATDESDLLNGRRTGTSFTDEQLAPFMVREGRIGRSQYLRFIYNNAMQGSATLAKDLGKLFMDKFYYQSQAGKAQQVHFRIFTISDLREGKYDGTFMPKPGIPYAIVGSDGKSYKNAMFVRLQPQRLSKSDGQFQVLDKFRNSVAELEKLTGIRMGTPGFNNLVRIFKNSLEIVDEPTVDGITQVVRSKMGYNLEQFKLDAEAYFEANKMDTQNSNLLSMTADDKVQDAISTVQEVAKMIYGIDKEEENYDTEEQVTELGEEWEAIKNKRGGFYAQQKGTGPGTGVRSFKKSKYTLDSSKGVAQIAFNQLARSNEYTGGTRIRVEVPHTSTSERRLISKGKSLISSEGGSTRQYGLMKLIANQILSDTESTKADKADALNKVRRMVENSGQDPILFMKNYILEHISKSDEEDGALLENQLNGILNKKETHPVNLATLDLIVGDTNYDGGGQHMTKDKFTMNNRKGEQVTQPTFLRKPLPILKFNDLGSDPHTNAEELTKYVTTSFGDIATTQIDVDFGAVADVASDPVTVAPVSNLNEAHQAIEDQITELKKQLADPDLDILDEIEILDKIKELEDSRGRMPFDSSVNVADPGKRISVQSALTELKRMLPNLQTSEVEFVSKAILSKMQRPGEDLLGLFENSKIYLATDEDGQVYDKVLRHEVMHKIYNEFLSADERKALRKELDPNGRLTERDFDEKLADAFMEYQQPDYTGGDFTQKILNIFKKIAAWLGFANLNRSALDTIFTNIENGKYTKAVGGTSDVRRAFSSIKDTYGSVKAYQQAVKFIQGQVKDAVVVDSLNVVPRTMKEVKAYVQELLHTKRTEQIALAQKNQEAVTKAEAAITVTTDPERLTKLQQALEKAETNLEDAAGQVSILTKMLTGKSFDNIWKDMYPNYNFKSNEAVSSLDDDPDAEEEDTLTEEQQEEDKNSSSLADFVIQSDERNQEAKVTENVKNFLGFIFKDNGKPVNPRYAYLECLRTLNGLTSGSGDLKSKIRERAASNGINLKGRKSDGTYIIEALLNLVDKATSEIYYDKDNNSVELTPNQRFITENVFIYGSEGDISGSTVPEIEAAVRRGEVTAYTRGQNESTPEFISRIEAGIPALGKQQLIGYFRQQQAQETLREVMSNFLSQRESDPLIAEEARIKGNGATYTTLRYIRAQMFGAERVMATDIENAIRKNWLKLKPEQLALENEEGVKNLLSGLGIKKEFNNANSSLVHDILQNLRAFKHVVNESYVDGKPKQLTRSTEDDVLDEDSEIQYQDVEYLLSKETSLVNNLTKLLTKNSAEARPSKYVSVDGRTRYSFSNSNQALEAVQRVIESTGKFANKAIGLPSYLQSGWGAMNIFVEGKLNTINKIFDHDGMRREFGEEFAKGYSSENNAESLARRFSYAFLNFANTNASKSEKSLKYVQFFYTISNRPRMVGAEVGVLNYQELEQAAEKMLMQHLMQPETSSVKNYSRYKTINMELLGEAITEEMGARNKATYDELLNSPYKRDNIIKKFMAKLQNLSDTVAQRLVDEKVKIGDDVNKVTSTFRSKGYLGKDAGFTGQIKQSKTDAGFTVEQIKPLVNLWIANNYINGFFLNQIPVGNFNYFKSAIDLVKRMSGVFAPGTKGLVDPEGRFFMKPKFKMAIMEDPKMFSHELSEILKNTPLGETLKATGKTKKLVNGETRFEESGFDLADAQGFMLPSRAANIIAGMGEAYNAGNVFKPAHYEVAKRTAFDSSGNAIEIDVPVMIKYSSVVLTDELVEKYPRLNALREQMIYMQADELVFDSANKVGGPLSSRKVPATGDESFQFSIPDEALVELSNENFRLQLNPKHDPYASVSNPTQLGYFLNVLTKVEGKTASVNAKAAADVYQAIGKLIDHGKKKVMAGLTASGKVDTRTLQRTLTGAGNERIAEMLRAGMTYNMPNIADKALVQIMNLFAKESVKIKFKGGKFVLQSAYGVTKEDGSRLKYGTDENGRMYAEVMIDQSYQEKARIGDFLLPDLMGYRIPSTELHSSIALKVVGYYPTRTQTNTIVAPPELVMQHGSDFDVDSLYVLSRELAPKDIPALGISKGDPIGFERDPRKGNKFVLNKENWEKRFDKWYIQAGTDKKALKDVDAVFEMLQRNIIVESFLNVISHKDNIQRMTEPISTQVISDTLESLGLKGEPKMDLSNPLNDLEVFNSNFQGASLVGIFANGMKALAYMLKTGGSSVEAYPELQVQENAVELSGTVYDKFVEVLPDGKTIWQVLDALVNTSVDNVKEQQLYKMNATNRTGNIYVAMQAMGIPFDTGVTFMLQPIAKDFSKEDGKIDAVKENLKTRYNLVAGSPVETYPELFKEAENRVQAAPDQQAMKKWINQPINSLEELEVLKQVKLVSEFEKLIKLGEDISTFSRAVGIVQDFPVKYEDIAKKAEDWKKVGSIIEDKFVTNPDFSFNLDNLFTQQPNIREAYNTFMAAKETAELSLTKHLPAVRSFIAQVADESKTRLSYGRNEEDLKNELMNYLVSSLYSEELKNEEPIKYTYKGKERIATGKVAWSQKFIGKLQAAKAEGGNEFLNKIGITERFGLKTIQFSVSSNSDYMDMLEMQEAFEQLEDEQLKKGLVKYAVLNYGLKFGVKNYSMFIPAEYLGEVDQHLRNLDKAIRRNKIEEVIDENGKVRQSITEGELKNIKDNFMLRLALNNADKLPFISGKKMKPVQTEGKTIVVQTITGPESRPQYSGVQDGYFFNRRYANPLKGDEGKREFSEKDFPMFIKTDAGSSVIAMIRLNSPDNDFVYYQRLGFKNWAGGYDASVEALNGDYSLDKYFGPNLIPVPVADTRQNSFEVNNEYIGVGSRVIVYGFNNESRDQGKIAVVESVQGDLIDKAKKTIKVREVTEELNPQQTQFMARFNPIVQALSQRFNIPMQVVKDKEMPVAGVKGLLKDGVIYLNLDKMGWDTPFHEISHPLIEAISSKNPKWYGELLAELNSSERGKQISKQVAEAYPELSQEGQQMESVVTLLGELAADRLDNQSSLAKLAMRLFRAIGDLLRGILDAAGIINLDTLGRDEMSSLTLNDLAEVLSNKDANISLDLSGFTKSTRQQKELDDLEQKLFAEGRLILSCKS